MKSFTIGEAVVDNHKPMSYEVVITVMSGDADAYDTFSKFFDLGDETNMSYLIETLERMKAAYPHGRMGGGRNNYDNVEGFSQFDSEDDGWPIDVFDYETDASFDKYNIFYYDANLVKHVVEVS